MKTFIGNSYPEPLYNQPQSDGHPESLTTKITTIPRSLWRPLFCAYVASLVLRSRGQEGLVHTACACAELSRKNVRISRAAMCTGKGLWMKYTESYVQSTIWLALVRSSVRPSKKDSELHRHSLLEASRHIVRPSNAGKVSLSLYKSPVRPPVARSMHGASKLHGLLP